jgi:hypothetical protein
VFGLAGLKICEFFYMIDGLIAGGAEMYTAVL